MDLTSGYPYWSVRDGLLRAYPRLDGDVTCDVAVIGGGISGALVTHRLTEAGVDTIVLDKREVGWGSTSASTAVIQYEIDVTLADLAQLIGANDAERAYLACREAVGQLEELAGRLPDACGFVQKRSLYLASRSRDRRVLEKEHALRRAIGLEVEYLDEAAIAQRFALRRPAALLSAHAAQCDPYALTHALLRDATAKGARVFDRTHVARIDTDTDGVRLLTSNGCEVRARRLVFASGYESHPFLEPKVAKLISTYAVVSEPMASLDGWGEDQCVIWEHASPYLYLRTTDDGRVLIGGEDVEFRDPERRDRLLPKKRERLVRRFHELFPDLRFEPAFAWAGTFGETKDGLAYIGEHPHWPHAWFALGYGGNGITYSMLAADIIRDAMLGHANPHADLFRFGR